MAVTISGLVLVSYQVSGTEDVAEGCWRYTTTVGLAPRKVEDGREVPLTETELALLRHPDVGWVGEARVDRAYPSEAGAAPSVEQVQTDTLAWLAETLPGLVAPWIGRTIGVTVTEPAPPAEG